jgi:hypothetical protein
MIGDVGQVTSLVVAVPVEFAFDGRGMPPKLPGNGTQGAA